MKKQFFKIAIIWALASISIAAQAASVNVWGERYNLNTVNTFYDGLAGHNSSIITGDLNTNDLTGVDLLWAVQPANDYTASELATMATFLGDGGRIAFMGEHGTYAPAENDRITTAIATLGGNITIQNTVVDGGFRNATRVGGQILTHDLTEGVNTYNYAAFAPLINLGGNAEALMLGSNLTDVMMAYENIGPGSIFLITDQNVWDNVYSASNDNGRMFENLLIADTGAPPVNGVPEASSIALLGLGLFGLGFTRRNKKA